MSSPRLNQNRPGPSEKNETATGSIIPAYQETKIRNPMQCSQHSHHFIERSLVEMASFTGAPTETKPTTSSFSSLPSNKNKKKFGTYTHTLHRRLLNITPSSFEIIDEVPLKITLHDTIATEDEMLLAYKKISEIFQSTFFSPPLEAGSSLEIKIAWLSQIILELGFFLKHGQSPNREDKPVQQTFTGISISQLTISTLFQNKSLVLSKKPTEGTIKIEPERPLKTSP